MTISIVVVIKIASEHRARFCEGLQSLTVNTLAEPGCLLFDLFVPKEHSDEVVLIEKWRDQEAIATHMAQPYTIEFIEAMRALNPVATVRTLTDPPAAGAPR